MYAVAARDLNKATEYAKKWGIPKVFGGDGAYQSTWAIVISLCMRAARFFFQPVDGMEGITLTMYARGGC